MNNQGKESKPQNALLKVGPIEVAVTQKPRPLYSEEDVIQFYFVFTDTYGDSWTSQKDIFTIGIPYNGTNLSPFPFSFAIAVPLIALYKRRKRFNK